MALQTAVVIERNYAVLFAKRPPPPEPRQSSEHESGIAHPPQLLHVVEDGVERLLRPPVVGRDGDVAAELQDRGLFGVRQSCFLQDGHPLGFAQDVVVEGAFGYAEAGGGLGETHLLADHRLDGLLELALGPRRRF